MEPTDFLPPTGEHDLLRRIRQLAERAERTAHNRSNFVGPPPSQEHLDILAEIRMLSEEMTTTSRGAENEPAPRVNAVGRAEVLPRPARAADDLLPRP
ncbi:hypothetical protein BBK82_00755 [Lentzea guizhouensis]|uniref:Uncharacterized protein n=1 Tax=Lentzea guizhouensis TaxID=1586287 RepID=A0A1B2HAT3_9PSEU|nr:hypothetical protein [Lentzea guizhouensis]ANZ34824.1 hypothetical protein BBK82_00755 [Lentzea guizhouensis]